LPLICSIKGIKVPQWKRRRLPFKHISLRQLEHDEANPTMETLKAIFSIFGLELGLKRKAQPKKKGE